MAHEVALGVGGLHLRRLCPVFQTDLAKTRLVLRRVVDRLALLRLGEVVGLDRRVECLRNRGSADQAGSGSEQERSRKTAGGRTADGRHGRSPLCWTLPLIDADLCRQADGPARSAES